MYQVSRLRPATNRAASLAAKKEKKTRRSGECRRVLRRSARGRIFAWRLRVTPVGVLYGDARV